MTKASAKQKYCLRHNIMNIIDLGIKTCLIQDKCLNKSDIAGPFTGDDKIMLALSLGMTK